MENNYEKTIHTIERYLASKGYDFSSHNCNYKGKYRLAINNWFGCCESFVEINVDKENYNYSFKMYYNGVRAITRQERRNLSEYFVMANKSATYICYAGLNDDGVAYVEIKNDFELHPLTTIEEVQRFEKICTVRIVGDRVLVKEILELR